MTVKNVEAPVVEPIVEPVVAPEPQPTPIPVEPPPVAAETPAVPDDGDDMTNDFIARRQETEDDAARAALRAAMGTGGEEREPAKQPPVGAPTPPDSKPSVVKDVAMDVATGAAEVPSAIVGGARDAVQANIDLIGDAADWIVKKMPGMLTEHTSDEEAEALLGKEGYAEFLKKNPKDKYKQAGVELPKVAEPKSATGSLVRGVSQFLVGFVGPGGMAAKGIKASGTMGMVAKNMFRGAVTDYTSFDPQQKRLSDLVQQFPKLQNPLTEYLQSKPEDTKAVGRFKNALEGLGLGLVADGFIKTVGAVTSGKAADQVQRLMAHLNGEPPKANAVSEADLKILSEPAPAIAEADALAERKMQKGLDQTSKPSTSAKERDYVNFANINSSDDVKTLMEDMAQQGKAAIEENARGTRSHAQTKLAAEQEDAWKVLMERKKGEPLNAEQTYAARQLWVSSAEKLKQVAEIAAHSDKPSDIFAFRKMLAVHYAIQTEVLGARRETARALNQWRIPVGSGEEVFKQMEMLVENSGGAAVAKDLAEKITKLGSKGAVELEHMIAMGAPMARTKAAIAQIWVNGLLSNPATHSANAISNLASAAQQIFERGFAARLSQRFGTEAGVELGEALAMSHAVLQSFKEGMVAMSQRATNLVKGAKDTTVDDVLDFIKGKGDVSEDAAKWGGPDMGPGSETALSSERWSDKLAYAAEKTGIAETSLGSALDVIDGATRVPSRLLGKSDEIFKSMAYRMELNAQAVRRATQEMRGGKIAPADFKKRVAEIVAEPPRDINMTAMEQAAYQTFTSRPAAALKKLGDAVQMFPVIGRLLLPFKNTPINIMTYTAERTPLAPLVKQWRAEVAAGGARRDVALARMSTGSMILSTMMDLSMSGHITGGGPTDPVERQNWLRTHQPYSVKVGDKWVAFGRLDPLGFTLGIGADIGEAVVNAGREVSDHDFSQVMIGAAFSFSNQVMSKSYVRSISEFVTALSGGRGKQEAWVQRILGSMVPAGVAAVTRNGVPGLIEGDPYQRAAEGMVEALKRRIPGLSKELAPARNLWGDKIAYQSGLGWTYDMVSPVYLRSGKQEPIDKELEVLQHFPDLPNKKITMHETTLELNSKQYSRYQELAGNGWKMPGFNKGCKDFLNDVVTGKSPLSAEYQFHKAWDMKEGTTHARDFVQEWINKFREGARAQLMKEDNQLKVAFDDKNSRRSTRVPAKFLFQ